MRRGNEGLGRANVPDSTQTAPARQQDLPSVSRAPRVLGLRGPRSLGPYWPVGGTGDRAQKGDSDQTRLQTPSTHTCYQEGLRGSGDASPRSWWPTGTATTPPRQMRTDHPGLFRPGEQPWDRPAQTQDKAGVSHRPELGVHVSRTPLPSGCFRPSLGRPMTVNRRENRTARLSASTYRYLRSSKWINIPMQKEAFSDWTLGSKTQLRAICKGYRWGEAEKRRNDAPRSRVATLLSRWTSSQRPSPVVKRDISLQSFSSSKRPSSAKCVCSQGQARRKQTK